LPAAGAGRRSSTRPVGALEVVFDYAGNPAGAGTAWAGQRRPARPRR